MFGTTDNDGVFSSAEIFAEPTVMHIPEKCGGRTTAKIRGRGTLFQQDSGEEWGLPMAEMIEGSVGR